MYFLLEAFLFSFVNHFLFERYLNRFQKHKSSRIISVFLPLSLLITILIFRSSFQNENLAETQSGAIFFKLLNDVYISLTEYEVINFPSLYLFQDRSFAKNTFFAMNFKNGTFK